MTSNDTTVRARRMRTRRTRTRTMRTVLLSPLPLWQRRCD